jgi:hypothetical protein
MACLPRGNRWPSWRVWANVSTEVPSLSQQPPAGNAGRLLALRMQAVHRITEKFSASWLTRASLVLPEQQKEYPRRAN